MNAPFAVRLITHLGALVDHHCILCHQPGGSILCDCCASDIPGFDLARCGGNVLHWPHLHQGLASARLERLTAVGPHQWPLSRLISELKFGARPYVARALAELFVSRTNDTLARPEAIIPVPLHPRRLLRRHYNQAALMAAEIGRLLDIAVDDGGCLRRRHRPPQTTLSGRHRRTNLGRAFTAQPRSYRHVALLDDVVTTGATMASLTRAIVRSNPGIRIDHWSVSVSVPNAAVPTDK